MHQLRLFFVALQFLTRLPSPRWVGFEFAWLSASARWFPAVGTLVGLIGAGVFSLTSPIFPPMVAVLLSMVATVLLTGAFHEDGLADTCDALGGAVSRQRALEIMKDSRIGAYGAIALVLVLVLKAAALAALPIAWTAAVLVVAHTASRASAVVVMKHLAYAGDVEQAKAKPLATSVGMYETVFALGWTALLLAVGLAVGSLPAVVLGAVAIAGAAVTAYACVWLRRRLGGYTGDTLGATQQVCEVVMILVALGAASWLR